MRNNHTKAKKKNLVLYIVLLAGTIVAMICIKQCGGTSGTQRPADGNSSGDTLDIAISYTPMNYYLYADTLGGFNYDLLNLYSQQTGTPVKFWPIISLDDALRGLDAKNFDLIVSLPIDNKLKSKYLYTHDLFTDRQVLIQRKLKNGKLAVNSSLDLARDTLHIEKDSPARFRIRNLSHEIGDTIHIIEHADLSSEYLLLKVAAGDLKYAVVNERIAKPLLEIHPEVSIETPISFTQFQAWLLNRNDTLLLKRLNLWIDSIKTTDQYESLLKRYR